MTSQVETIVSGDNVRHLLWNTAIGVKNGDLKASDADKITNALEVLVKAAYVEAKIMALSHAAGHSVQKFGELAFVAGSKEQKAIP